MSFQVLSFVDLPALASALPGPQDSEGQEVYNPVSILSAKLLDPWIPNYETAVPG